MISLQTGLKMSRPTSPIQLLRGVVEYCDNLNGSSDNFKILFRFQLISKLSPYFQPVDFTNDYKKLSELLLNRMKKIIFRFLSLKI